MTSLFRTGEYARILQRIDALRPESKSLWGKMQVAQMVAHCQAPLRVATGDLPLKRGLIGILFGRLAKKKLAGPQPFGRGMPTAPEFRVTGARDFARERDRLRELVVQFGRNGPDGLTKLPHPFFGPMTVEEWDTLQWKHLDHHLRQFGV